jgi:hypothetical protein
MWNDYLQANSEGFTEIFQSRVNYHMDGLLGSLASSEYQHVYEAWEMRNRMLIRLRNQLANEAFAQRSDEPGLSREEWIFELKTRALVRVIAAIRSTAELADIDPGWRDEERQWLEYRAERRGVISLNEWEALFVRQYLQLRRLSYLDWDGTQLLSMSLG